MIGDNGPESVGGLVTVEKLVDNAWLLRGRDHDESLYAPYHWIMALVRAPDGVGHVMGFLARDRREIHRLSQHEWNQIYEIAVRLGFEEAHYVRRGKDGGVRKTMKITKQERP